MHRERFLTMLYLLCSLLSLATLSCAESLLEESLLRQTFNVPAAGAFKLVVGNSAKVSHKVVLEGYSESPAWFLVL